ncbi:MAG: 2-oxoacid ferredoxin oxidoreductase [Chloroflexi bacterium]|nr:2-oxoacid ferredoxin oxidoreductase [Chloroflexota bacterium]
MIQLADYTGATPAWCPGCGNFGILTALNNALVALEIEPNKVLMVSGIGQAAKLPHYTRGNILNSLHGRALPPAIGAKIANPELTVIAVGGDGDGYGEGANHFINAIRRNHDITYLVHNNQVYGLTKGQASPTSDFGFITKTTPHGADIPLNPIALAVAANGTFVARSFAGDIDHLSQLIIKGIQHRGFALLDILQPCVSFNHKNTYSWYRERVYDLDLNGHNPENKADAFAKSQEWEESIPIGLIYREDRATYEERLPALKRGALVQREFDPMHAEKLLNRFL